ncbi:MAG TPA: hypothetical protein VMM15_05575 [Bradyrhizobium sp.]|nr:hypothetical protein [Bradyrhizobium sp.]
MKRPIYAGNGTSKPDVVIATEEDCHAVILLASHHIRSGVRDVAMDRTRMQAEENQSH